MCSSGCSDRTVLVRKHLRVIVYLFRTLGWWWRCKRKGKCGRAVWLGRKEAGKWGVGEPVADWGAVHPPSTRAVLGGCVSARMKESWGPTAWLLQLGTRSSISLPLQQTALQRQDRSCCNPSMFPGWWEGLVHCGYLLVCPASPLQLSLSFRCIHSVLEGVPGSAVNAKLVLCNRQSNCHTTILGSETEKRAASQFLSVICGSSTKRRVEPFLNFYS